LVDLAKYDSIIHDLSAIEAEIATVGNKLRDTEERKTELEIQVAKLRQDNLLLQKKVIELEQEILLSKQDEEGNIFNTLNTKEKENLKLKLQDIISKIDFHLSS
jgi:predicted nuclease with TOPRIM domain